MPFTATAIRSPSTWTALQAGLRRRWAIFVAPLAVLTVNRPWMNSESSGETRGSPFDVTVANATCFVPWRYVTTWRAVRRRFGGDDVGHVLVRARQVRVEHRLELSISASVSNIDRA